MNFQTLRLYRCAARVQRMHTLPTIYRQSVGEHTFGVYWLAKMIMSPRKMSPQLADFIMSHDVPESLTGDVPSPTLNQYQDLRTAMVLAEINVKARFEVPDPKIEAWEFEVFKYSDRMEFVCFAHEEVSMGNSMLLPRVKGTLRRIWEEGLHKVTPAAEELWHVMSDRTKLYPEDHGAEVLNGWVG